MDCDEFILDLAAPFGTCKCGQPKSAHKASALVRTDRDVSSEVLVEQDAASDSLSERFLSWSRATTFEDVEPQRTIDIAHGQSESAAVPEAEPRGGHASHSAIAECSQPIISEQVCLHTCLHTCLYTCLHTFLHPCQLVISEQECLQTATLALKHQRCPRNMCVLLIFVPPTRFPEP